MIKGGFGDLIKTCELEFNISKKSTCTSLKTNGQYSKEKQKTITKDAKAIFAATLPSSYSQNY
jgi:hypothetical protein